MNPLSALPLGWRFAEPPEVLSTPLRDFARGKITEITGPRFSGRARETHALLAAATARGEFAVLVDAQDGFDPPSAEAAGVVLSRVIWIRCKGNVEHAMRAADLVIHSGGFGVVALDLAECSVTQLNRIPPTAWFRFRRAVEPTPTVLVVVSDRPLAKSCARPVKMPPRQAVFTGKPPFLLLKDVG
jgi:recA bacterial DNA recombination protein